MHFSYGFCSEKVAQMESDTVRHRDVYRDVLSDIAVILILLLFI